MFGIGGQEMVTIGLIFLVVFGPGKLSQVARDLGKFANEARRSMDEFKGELISDDDEDKNQHPKRQKSYSQDPRMPHATQIFLRGCANRRVANVPKGSEEAD